MDTFAFVMIPVLVPFFFLLLLALRPVKCPDCGEKLPVLQSPLRKTQRMWRAGGYICSNCGCETNLTGEKITADTPPAPFPTLQWTLVGVFMLIGIGLWAAILYVGPAVAAPPLVAAPQQAPALVK